KGALTYTDIAGDPVLYVNFPPREISMNDVFRYGGSSKKFTIAEGQWYRYAPSYVSSSYRLLVCFLFILDLSYVDLFDRLLILLLITCMKASQSFRNRLLVICKNAYLFATMIMTSVSSPFSCCSGIVRLNLMGPFVAICRPLAIQS